ncbi:hypothetical protein FACS1894205_0380 [Alphaproteobacteria bacterium]|nr:hypothetical protein FACS1894205_0380 [Alphaproteobacteria bacterium]
MGQEKATAITLVGHTDATGSVKYNLALSLRSGDRGEPPKLAKRRQSRHN